MHCCRRLLWAPLHCRAFVPFCWPVFRGASIGAHRGALQQMPAHAGCREGAEDGETLCDVRQADGLHCAWPLTEYPVDNVNPRPVGDLQGLSET